MDEFTLVEAESTNPQHFEESSSSNVLKNS